MKIFIDLCSRMVFCLHDLPAVFFFDPGNPEHKRRANRQYTKHGDSHSPVIQTDPYNGNCKQRPNTNGIGQPVAERVLHIGKVV